MRHGRSRNKSKLRGLQEELRNCPRLFSSGRKTVNKVGVEFDLNESKSNELKVFI